MAENLRIARRTPSGAHSNADVEDKDDYGDNFAASLTRTCCVCNGYYGPSFGEPVCCTCHAFLYPLNKVVPMTQISDNDEPPYAQRDLPVLQAEDDVDAIEPDPPRSLQSLLNALGNNSEAIPVSTDVEFSILPVEVLLKIFSYLDDISLVNIAQVNKHWHLVVTAHTPQSTWQRYTKMRFPLFRNILPNINWFKIYSALISSCFCKNCVIQMALPVPPQREYHIPRRLRVEMFRLNAAPEGVEAIPLDGQLRTWQASITGPPNSPYEGGKFFLYIIIPLKYPFQPPVVRFLTKIIHPNVSRHGNVGIDIIQHNWHGILSIYKVLLSVQSLLTDPFTQICMEPELGRLYETNPPRFEALARRWTKRYAMHEVIP